MVAHVILAPPREPRPRGDPESVHHGLSRAGKVAVGEVA